MPRRKRGERPFIMGNDVTFAPGSLPPRLSAAPSSDEPLVVRIDARFARWRGGPLLVALLTAVLVTGDLLTDVEITFSLLYLVPIMLAAWYRGRGFGSFVALLCTAGALGTDVITRLEHGWPIHAFKMSWNYGGSLVIFVGAAFVVTRLREYVAKDREARRATVAQLRQAERLGVVGQLAAGVAHELGTPLNVIVGHAEMIESGLVQPPMVGASAHAILGQAQKMATIIRGLLDFSRRGGAEKSLVDLGGLAGDAALLVRTIARRAEVEVDVLQPSEKVFVRGNRTELEQVLLNLMMNGIQAMSSGGTLRVTVHHDAQRGAPRPAACVDVIDSGIGIPPENLARIFDPFFTTKDVGVGTGLGLSVSYGIVADHDGHIEVASTPGTGSRFSVHLPAVVG